VPLASTIQDDWSGAIYRGKRTPPNAAFDIINGFVDADRLIYRRGGNAYQSTTDAGETLLGIAAPHLPIGSRTIAWGSGGLHVLDTDDVTPVSISGTAPRALSRPAGLNGLVAFPSSTGGYAFLYGGSLNPNGYATGTVTVTSSSETVTGVGTSWLANAAPGMIFGVGSTTSVVLSVDSDTQITLIAPWPGTTAAGAAYALNPKALAGNTTVADYAGTDDVYVAAVGAVARLLIATKQRVYFSERGDPFSFDSTVYHEIPAGIAIVGATSIGDTAVIFTTAGAWTIDNMSLDPIDAYGNIQHTVAQLNEIVLWGDPGLAIWSGALLVPAVDDVYLMPLGASPQPISGARGTQWDDGIRALYRSYVKAGYQPGTAAVHQGHYFLPIVNGTALIDTLVCNLSGGFVWSRLAGHAADIAYAVRVPTAARTPRLLGVSGQRILNNTGIFDPTGANMTDADGTTSNLVLTTRDYPTGANQPGVAHKIRARYELASSNVATVAVAYSSDQDAGSFTTLTSRGGQNGTGGWTDSDGSLYQWANVGKKRERIRFRLTVAGACTRFVLRSVELLTRPSGKQ
jgi:hypothetical protein